MLHHPIGSSGRSSAEVRSAKAEGLIKGGALPTGGYDFACRITYFHLKNRGEPGEARTRDNRLKRAVLYQLSYRPTKFINYIITKNTNKHHFYWLSLI
jgi:hypothetical protein